MSPLDILDRAVATAGLMPWEAVGRHRDHDVHKCTVRWCHAWESCPLEPVSSLTRSRARSLVRALESLGLEARIGTEDPVGIEIVFAEVLPADVLETCLRVDGEEASRCAS